MNKFTAEHELDVAELLTSVTEALTVEPVQTKKRENWLMRFSEGSYEYWHKSGKPSYGL